MEREPLGQALNSIARELAEVARMADNPATYEQVAAEEGLLWYVKCQIEFICSYIKETEDRKPRQMRVVK